VTTDNPMPYPPLDEHDVLCRSLDEAEARLGELAVRAIDAAYEIGKAINDRSVTPEHREALSAASRVHRFALSDAMRETFHALKDDLEAAGVPAVRDT